jgi:4-hydroxy-3-methylbut-2-enyl diphosphate reductase
VPAGGHEIVLIGHGDHEEVEGTLGEVPPGQMHLVADAGEVDDLEVADPERVAYLTQTTLAVDETAQTIAALRRRFPAIVGPNSDDICYATQNRQDAVRAVAADCDVVLVVGSQNSSNSNRLVEVAERAGARAWLIEDESEIEPAWLKGATRVGLTAGASARESLVQRVLGALEVLGPVETSERTVTRETTRFKLPVEVRETTRSRKAQQVDHSTKPETD